MVRETSKEANRDNESKGLYGTQRQRIVIALKEMSWSEWVSRRDLAQQLDIENSAIQRPIGDLIKDGVIEEQSQKSLCPITKRNVLKIRLCRGQKELFNV